MAIGAGVGFGLVAGMTAVELRMGWVHPLGWFETVDPKERFGLNLLVGAALQPASQLAARPPSHPTSQPTRQTSLPPRKVASEPTH